MTTPNPSTLPQAPSGPPDASEVPWWERYVSAYAVDLSQLRTAAFDKTAVSRDSRSVPEQERELLAFAMNLLIDVKSYNSESPLLFGCDAGDSRKALTARVTARFSEYDSIRQRATSPEIKARMSDLIWSFRGKQRVALSVCHETILAYLDCCSQIQKSGGTPRALLGRLVRAMRLSAEIQDEELQARVVTQWRAAVAQELRDGGHLLALSSARILKGTKCPMVPALGLLLDSHVEAIDEVSFCMGDEEELCDLAAAWPRGNAKLAHVHAAKAADVALQRAKKMLARDHQGFLSLDLARKAVARTKKSHPARLPEALQLLQSANSKIAEDAFVVYSGNKKDVSHYVRTLKEQVAGASSAQAALLAWVTLPILPSKRAVLTAVKAEPRPDSLPFVTTISWSPDGRSAPEPAMPENAALATDDNPAVLYHAHARATVQRALGAGVAVKVCLPLMVEEHGAPALRQAVTEVLRKSMVVPNDRKQLVLHGALAALSGDMVTALHFLIPQVEMALRFQLTRRGLAATTPSRIPGEIQVALLDELLRRMEAHALLPEDIVFNLRGLLAEDAGGNLRNKHSHGLMSTSDYESSEALFLFWIVLKLLHDIN